MSTGLATLALDDPRWARFVGDHPDATPFHHPAWSLVLSKTYRFPARVLAITAESGRIAAGLPVLQTGFPLRRPRWVSLPFTDHCTVLVRAVSQEAVARSLADEARRRGLRALEVRDSFPSADGVYPRPDGVLHTLDLSRGFDALHADFGRGHRRNIRTARKAGLTIERGSSGEDLAAFFRLHLLTRRRQGLPVQPRRFFRLLADSVIRPGLGFVATVRMAGEPIASAILLAWKGVVIYKWSASDSRHWRFCPNNLLLGSAIRWACEDGCRTFDLGSTALANEGLRRFKSGWGAREEPLVRTVITETPPAESGGRLQSALGVVIRRSPPLVCRTAGALLYRYAA